MISVSVFEAETKFTQECAEVDYLLRRADHETVAAIQALDPRASDSHAGLALHYGAQSRELLGRLDERRERLGPD